MIDLLNAAKFNCLRLGLVLSGGGAKGSYQIGVFDALYDLGLRDMVRAVSGTSVGALNLMVFAMNDRSLGRELWKQVDMKRVLAVEEENKTKSQSPFREKLENIFLLGKDNESFMDLLMDVTQSGLSPFSQEELKALIECSGDFARIKDGGLELYSCMYDINDKKPVYARLDTATPEAFTAYVLASSSIPYLFPPVEIDGKLYADGGINNPAYKIKNADNTPITPLKNCNLDAIIVVHLSNENLEHAMDLPDAELINIYPNNKLESVKGIGSIYFDPEKIETKIEQGYTDSLKALVPWISKKIVK